MADITDEERMIAVAEGNQAAFRQIVAVHLDSGHAIAFRFLGNRPDAEEAVQDAFTKVWMHAARFDPDKARFKTWFVRILSNTCLDRMKARIPPAANIDALQEVLPGKEKPQDAALFQKQESEKIKQAVQSLPERQRIAVMLCYFEEMTNPEAAAAMNMHVKALEGLLVRARKTLKQILGE